MKGHTLDSAAALNAAERLVRLFKDPQPGLGTWCGFLATAMADFDKAVGYNDVERAAPDLLQALRWTNRDTDHEGKFCNCPLGDGTRPDREHATSCVDARHAIAKAEGRS